MNSKFHKKLIEKKSQIKSSIARIPSLGAGVIGAKINEFSQVHDLPLEGGGGWKFRWCKLKMNRDSTPQPPQGGDRVLVETKTLEPITLALQGEIRAASKLDFTNPNNYFPPRLLKVNSSSKLSPSPSFFFVLSLLSAFLFLTSCENDLAEVERMVNKDEIKYETMNDVELLYSDSAILRVKVMGDKMLRYLDVNTPTQEFPVGVNVDFFDQRGRTQSELTSKYAIRFEKKNEIIVRDSVVWESKAGDRLETEELIWDEKSNKVYTKKFVKITRPGEIIYGYGFEANQDFTRWEINAITGRIKVDGLTKEFKE